MVWKAHTIKGSNVLNKGIGVISYGCGGLEKILLS